MTEHLERHPQTWEILLKQMDIAIRQAIEDAQRHKRRHRVTEGTVEQAGMSGFRYSFLLHDEWEPGANTSILIEVDPDDPNTSIAGSVLSVLNARVTLVMEAPLPDVLLEQAVLLEATVWLLQRLQQAVLRIQSQQETAQSVQMGKSIVGLLPTRQGRDRRQLQIASFTPDRDQARAVEIGMASEQVLVIGPLGSGKTSVESALAAEYLYAGKTVLVVAPTNVALDTLMLRLKEYAQQTGARADRQRSDEAGHAHWHHAGGTHDQSLLARMYFRRGTDR